MAQRNTDIATRQQRPFSMLERFTDEIESLFDFGFGRNFGRTQAGAVQMWAPRIDVSHQNNELVVRADLPGMKREDISVEAGEHELIISGERRQEEQGERGGMYHSERIYGSFYRAIPLPEGAIADQAQATFTDGVLEIRLPAPPEQASRGRKLEIKAGASAPEEAKQEKAKK